jgi:hypothetical protein
VRRTGPPARRNPLARARARTRMVPGPSRDWTEARAKVSAERVCRLGEAWVAGADACQGAVQAAHVIGRSKADEPHPDGSGRLIVRAMDVVPLCGYHHAEYDAHRLDLLPYLTPSEQTRAVQVAGGIMAALVRISGRRSRTNPYRSSEAT